MAAGKQTTTLASLLCLLSCISPLWASDNLSGEMIVIPGGSFTMGDLAGTGNADERPLRQISIQPFALAKHEVTIAQFKHFAKTSNYRSTAEQCQVFHFAPQPTWSWNKQTDWQSVSFDSWQQPDNHPVVCVSFSDVMAYIQWLNQKGDGGFRLPTEAEWEYAARAGSQNPHFYRDVKNQCDFANGADATQLPEGATWKEAVECTDGHIFTAPVGSFTANQFGLHDMLGNVWEWVADCYTDSYQNLPLDGSAQDRPNCQTRVRRGGGWYEPPYWLRTANRAPADIDKATARLGFRLARDLPTQHKAIANK
ncbi:formylglycine-generating enzyme family protein [bacterium SCSIO 12696]|nr:formylglycine-generating enzyme family protein [bacterium SCSIO 12696]